MHVSKKILLTVAGLFCGNLFAQQTTPYILTDFPLVPVDLDTTVWVKWAGLNRNPVATLPDSGKIYYSKTPCGSILANYSDSIGFSSNMVIVRYDTTRSGSIIMHIDTLRDTVFNKAYASASPPQRGIRFNPSHYTNMRPGKYYFMVALKRGSTYFYSNELQIIIQSNKAVTLKSPKDTTISELTPLFKWEANPGVPYYHLLLSDEEIALEDNDIAGLSIVWQAITSNTQITYGAPDPSGTIVADPPPISPGKTYSWVVLNNYGNHPALSSTKFGLPTNFTVAGDTLKAPQPCYPANNATLNNVNDSVVTFKWTNIDSKANTYRLYIYMMADSASYGGVQAKLVLWQKEVTAASFTHDTGYVTVPAASILSTSIYSWKVIAVDDKGAGTSGPMIDFHYQSVTGTIYVYTREKILAGGTTLIQPVSLTNIQLQVLDGSTEAPLLYYTDNNGLFKRTRLAGTYRLTAIKSGFENASKTIVLGANTTTNDTIYMSRPEATIYGKVADDQNIGVDLATVIGISDQNDTVKIQSDNNGNFVLNCYGGKWNIYGEKTGFISSVPSNVSVSYGESYNFSTITLKYNPLTFSGTVKNTLGQNLIGANVKLLRSNQVISEVPSTPTTGAFSFSVERGTYTLSVTKVGFTSFGKTIDILSTQQYTVSMAPGAALVQGFIYGSSWLGGSSPVYAPINKATVVFIDTITNDTFKTTSDAVYGNYQISLAGLHTFRQYASATGYANDTSARILSTLPGTTQDNLDTLLALARVSGTVRDSTGSALANVNVSVLRASNRQVLATGKSQTNGYFEIQNIPDGLLVLQAGKDGYKIDSVTVNDSFTVTVGRSSISSFNVYMSQGAKTIRWVVNNGTDTTATITTISPLRKILTAKDTLGQMGSGQYLISASSTIDSVLMLATHRFTVADSEIVHYDSILLPLSNSNGDSLPVINDSITFRISKSSTVVVVDSVRIYYRDINSSTFDSALFVAPASLVFKVKPRKDGSTMSYFMRVFCGNNEYGSSSQAFYTYIRPNPKLSKLEMVPSTTDTLMFPSVTEISFQFRAYYGSLFLPQTTLDDSKIHWAFDVAQGNTFKGNVSTGKSITVVTSPAASIGPVTVTATFDTSGSTKLLAGVPASVSLTFMVSGSKLKSISVVRTDPLVNLPISTSGSEKAEFIGVGHDYNDSTVSISPVWSIDPVGAGTIDVAGTFLPSRGFVGRVRVYARVGAIIIGEYSDVTGQNGVEVNYVIRANSSTTDTASNKNDLSIIFPDSVVTGSTPGMLRIAPLSIDNRNAQMSGDLTVVSNIYDITETKNVAFTFVNDSIHLSFAVPSAYQRGNSEMFVATWDEDSLIWRAIANSQASDDRSSVTAKITHFSRYALLVRQNNASDAFLRVCPNRFSPYVSPVNTYMTGAMNKYGTKISFMVSSKENTVKTSIRIFNVLGDIVFEISNGAVYPGHEYSFWWNGKTAFGQGWSGLYECGPITGTNMCRNGRYYVTLTVDEGRKKFYYKEPVILIK